LILCYALIFSVKYHFPNTHAASEHKRTAVCHVCWNRREGGLILLLSVEIDDTVQVHVRSMINQSFKNNEKFNANKKTTG